LHFEAGKNYLFYSFPDFKVALRTSGPSTVALITSVGVTFGEHKFLATEEDSEPRFYLDNLLLDSFTNSTYGELEIFTPELSELRGALAELSKYVMIGAKIRGLIEIVGGIHPLSGCFFNIEVYEAHEFAAGLLKEASVTRTRDANFLSAFEIDSLF